MIESEVVVIQGIVIASVALVGATVYLRRSIPGWTPSLGLLAAVYGSIVAVGLLAAVIGCGALVIFLVASFVGLSYLLIRARSGAPSDSRAPASQPWFLTICLVGTALAVGAMVLGSIGGR